MVTRSEKITRTPNDITEKEEQRCEHRLEWLSEGACPPDILRKTSQRLPCTVCTLSVWASLPRLHFIFTPNPGRSLSYQEERIRCRYIKLFKHRLLMFWESLRRFLQRISKMKKLSSPRDWVTSVEHRGCKQEKY